MKDEHITKAFVISILVCLWLGIALAVMSVFKVCGG